jgi:MYXO-CTERM domain-containing protein
MSSATRLLASIVLLSAVALPLATSPAHAEDGGTGASAACGTFDFSGPLSCKIAVSGGCTASCTVDKLEIACGGHCSASATQTCTDDCGTACVQRCDPSLLDCFAGCHAECDGPIAEQCRTKHPGEDCGKTAVSQCDIHCKDTCKIPPSNCAEHCNKCCVGSCDTQINFDCDFSCLADVKVSCNGQCQKPEGGIFCNDQFVNAPDVDACIAYLATKSVRVDTSARVTASCTGSNCGGKADVGASAGGCSIARAADTRNAAGFMTFASLALAAAFRRRRRD